MPLDWRAYDDFDWSNAQQAPLDETHRAALAEFAAELLDLPAEPRAQVWGAAAPPGRFAATVIRISPGVPHRYAPNVALAAVPPNREPLALGVKIFKTTADAQRAGRRLLPFHGEQIHRLPGLPNPRVQRSFDAGMRRDAHGQERFYVVQEWAVGETLEDLLRRRWPQQPPDAARVRSILTQLFTGIVIPLWSAGTVWWDVRDANYCYAAETDTLKLIDVDSLAAYADEILCTPTQWTLRDHGRGTALARLRQMTLRLLQAPGTLPKKEVERRLRDAWTAELEPALRAAGKPAPEFKSVEQTPSGLPNALNAFQSFWERLSLNSG